MQNKAFIAAFLALLGILVDTQILLSHPTVQLNGLYHPVSVMHSDHVPSYALSTNNQKPTSTPTVQPVVITTTARGQLSPTEKLQRCHILMTEFTLLLNKLIVATSLADRQMILDRIHQIVVELQSLETKFMDKKLDEKIVLIVVPVDTSKDSKETKKEPTPSQNLKIVNPFENSHPFNLGDLMNIAMIAREKIGGAQQPAQTATVSPTPSTDAKTSPQKPTIAGNPFTQPTVLTAAVQQPAVVASTVAQPARIVYPIGSPALLPSYTLASSLHGHQMSYHPVVGSYIARSNPIHIPVYGNRMTLFQTNPAFAKSLAALKK